MSSTSAEKAPVIVIDLQTNMFDGLVEPPLHEADLLTDRARKVIDWARREGRAIAFVRHDGPEGIRWRRESRAGPSGRRSASGTTSRPSRRPSGTPSAIRNSAHGSKARARPKW